MNPSVSGLISVAAIHKRPDHRTALVVSRPNVDFVADSSSLLIIRFNLTCIISLHTVIDTLLRKCTRATD